MQGLVVLLEANRPTVETDQGQRFLCYLRGKIKREQGRIMVGDTVKITPTDPGEAIITQVEPRSNSLFRPPVANVSGLFVVFSFKEPRGSLELLDKRLVMADILNLDAEIVITKTDLIGDQGGFEHWVALYRDIGYRVWLTSIVAHQSISDFAEAPRTGIWVMAGESGAGKSSLVQALLPNEEVSTQRLSRIGRGQQTTRWVRLFKTYQFWLADTPGYTALEMSVKDPRVIRAAFWEWEDVSCRYSGCFHIDEPGCEVIPKVEEGLFNTQRYAHYRLILNQWVKHC